MPFSELPPLPYPQAQPTLARAGQATLCITATVHGGSVATAGDCKSMHLGFIPGDLDLEAFDSPARRSYLSEVRARLRPERRHLLPA